MSIGGFVRRTVFWHNDIRKKEGKMYSAYKEIKQINANRTIENEQYIQKTLENLLIHAVSSTDYYAKVVREGTEISLDKFPVINKQTVIENREAMFSKKYIGKKLHEMHTSGSTGIPFTIQQNMEKRTRVIAEIKAMNDLAGYPSHEKMLYILGAARKDTYYSYKQQFRENIYRIGVGVNDDSAMQELVDFLIKKKPVALHASASSLIPLVEYIRKCEISPKKFRIRTIITGGEMVPEKLRQDLCEVFGNKCKVAVKYSNEEMGILAQDHGSGTPYIMNVANYFFEILKIDSDLPADPGEQGRIVITDLYNYAIPLIRYDTGDIGCLENVPDQWPVLSSVSGKRRDLIFNTEGYSISGATFTNLLKYVKGVRMWQLIQETEKEYRYVIVPETNVNPRNEDILLQDLQELLGRDAKISVEMTDEIPTTNSQKRRYTVNLYKPQ